VIVLAVISSLLTLLLGQAVAAPSRATLRLDEDVVPAVLQGAHFQPREHVRVVVLSGTTRTVRKLVATRLGRFALRMPADMNACQGFSATAVGSKGTKATFKRAPGQCPNLAP
jgi:hypothetical protein